MEEADDDDDDKGADNIFILSIQ